VTKRHALTLSFLLPPVILGLLFAIDPPDSTAVMVIGLVCVFVWVYLGLPLGIVIAMDLLRTRPAASGAGRVARQAVRLPLFAFGLLCLGSGIAIFVLQVYILVRERRLQPSGVAVLLAPFGLQLIRLSLRPQEGGVTPDETSADGLSVPPPIEPS
jgi:hypothetical protein